MFSLVRFMLTIAFTGVFLLGATGCAQTPTAQVPSVTPEAFETPTPTPTDVQRLPATQTETPEAASKILKPEELVGNYTCQTIAFSLNADGTYKMDVMTGTYTRATDTELTWTSGEIGTKYERTSTFTFYANPPALNLVALGQTRSLDLICKRDSQTASPSPSPSTSSP